MVTSPVIYICGTCERRYHTKGVSFPCEYKHIYFTYRTAPHHEDGKCCHVSDVDVELQYGK